MYKFLFYRHLRFSLAVLFNLFVLPLFASSALSAQTWLFISFVLSLRFFSVLFWWIFAFMFSFHPTWKRACIFGLFNKLFWVGRENNISTMISTKDINVKRLAKAYLSICHDNLFYYCGVRLAVMLSMFELNL